MPPEVSLLITCASLVVATIAQRVVGMGFGIIMAPVVAIVAGPYSAVLVVNLFAALACALMVPYLWRDIDWGRLLWLVVPASFGSIVGLLLARVTDADVLRLGVGVAAILGVVVSVVFERGEHTVDAAAARTASGTTIGILNSAVALGAPAIAVYSMLSRWSGPSFSATMQPFWVVLSLMTLLQRQVIAPGGAPAWPWWGWACAAMATVVGSITAERVAHRVTPRAARLAVIVLSLTAGLSVTGVGIFGLLG
ncbi:sulfite exporter TauE/SafE family protein [Mobilicoccus caccae]|uniref:Probable membrane transporter protein n=1 Tax=Mobilicoccus caccae TaxID=1859295 RepID=A0ABQ6IST6_9MICO|nr:sulfite exporter TauE/SafE family protein [Mobilicoccus caccae]GMA40348.1 hypothetical protein GCM10025883_23930 [Mobilicoccus caccae]